MLAEQVAYGVAGGQTSASVDAFARRVALSSAFCYPGRVLNDLRELWRLPRPPPRSRRTRFEGPLQAVRARRAVDDAQPACS